MTDAKCNSKGSYYLVEYFVRLQTAGSQRQGCYTSVAAGAECTCLAADKIQESLGGEIEEAKL